MKRYEHIVRTGAAALLATALSGGSAMAQQFDTGPQLSGDVVVSDQVKQAAEQAAEEMALDQASEGSDLVLRVPVEIHQASGFEKLGVRCIIGRDIGGTLANSYESSSSDDSTDSIGEAINSALA